MRPFQKYEKAKFETIEEGSALKTAEFMVEPSGTTYASAATVNVTLGTLPANAVINKSYFYIESPIVSASSNKLAVKCKTANDLFTATALNNTSKYASGVMVNGAVNWANTASATRILTGTTGCSVIAVVSGSGTTGLTGGILHFIVEYLGL
jgi:hypothetical protein